MIALLLICAALAAEHWVVRPGDTVESIASELGEPGQVAEIRALNKLGAAAQPAVGTVLYLPPASQGSQEQQGLVTAVRGTGTARLPGQEPTPLRPQMVLPLGTEICTDAESFAAIRLARDLDSYAHDDLTLLPNTCLTLDGAAARAGHRSSLVNMREGSVAVRGTPERPGDVIVGTPSGLSTGEAGGFRVTLEPGATRTEAITAPVSVMGAGQEVTLEAKQGTRVREGQAPEAPRGLLSGGALFTPEEGAALTWPDFRWASVPRALGYRVQVSTSPDFAEVVHQEDVPFPEWQPDFLFLPFRVDGYWWRVSPLDRFGFEGLPSEPRRLSVPPGVGP